MLEEAVMSAKKQSCPTEIHVIKDNNQRGPAWARNVGISRATCRYIAFLDADDRWHADKLQRQIQCLKNTNSGMCIEGENITAENLQRRLLLSDISSKTSSILIDQDAIDVEFDTSIERKEDHLFLLEASLQTEVCSVPEIVEIRKHSGGLSAETDPEMAVLSRNRFYKQAVELVDPNSRLESQSRARLYFRNGRTWHYAGNYKRAINQLLMSIRYGPYWKALPAIISSIFNSVFSKVKRWK